MKRFITILIAALFMAAPVLADTMWRPLPGQNAGKISSLQPGGAAFYEVDGTETTDSLFLETKNCLTLTINWYGTALSAAEFQVWGVSDQAITYQTKLLNDSGDVTLDGTVGRAWIHSASVDYLFVETTVAAGGVLVGGIKVFCVKGYK